MLVSGQCQNGPLATAGQQERSRPCVGWLWADSSGEFQIQVLKPVPACLWKDEDTISQVCWEDENELSDVKA